MRSVTRLAGQITCHRWCNGSRGRSWSASVGLFFVIAFSVPLPLVIGGCSGNPSANGGSSSPSESSFARIKRTKLLRVGYIVEPPWVIRDPSSGTLSGTSIDTINEIAGVLGVKTEFTEATYGTFIAGLQTGKYDLSIAPTFSTIQRAANVAFSRPQMYVGNSAVARASDNRFKTLADIDKLGVVVAVTQGEQGHEYAKANFKHATLKVLSGVPQSVTFTEVIANRADVALGDAWVSSQFASTHPEVRDVFASDPYNLTPVAWSVRYEDLELLTFINTCIDYLDSIGKLQEWDHKYGAKWLRPRKLWQKS